MKEFLNQLRMVWDGSGWFGGLFVCWFLWAMTKRFSMKAILHGCRLLMVSCKVLCWHTYLRG